MSNLVYQLDECAKRNLAIAPTYIPQCLEYLAAREIERLQEIEQAAKNLIMVRGRHHSELAYKKLEELLK